MPFHINFRKINLAYIFGRIDAEAEAPILRPPDTKSWLIRKDPDAGKDWGKEKRATEGEMVGWHHWLNRLELGQIPGDGEGQGSQVCCSSWGHEELNTTWQLNNGNVSTKILVRVLMSAELNLYIYLRRTNIITMLTLPVQRHCEFSSVQLLRRIRLCNPMDCSMPGSPIFHCLPEFAQTHVHWVSFFPHLLAMKLWGQMP